MPLPSAPPRSPLQRSARRQPGRRSARAVLRLVLAAAVAGAGLWGAFAAGWLGSNDGEDNPAALLANTIRGDFDLSITERGEIESAGDTEVRSEVKTQNTAGLAILRLIPEGTSVEPGDFLVELDSSALRESRTTQEIAVNTAEALVVEARNLYETAIIAKKEYLDGVYVQERQTIESEVFVAQEDLSRAQEYLEYSKKLAAKGYVSELQLKADAFAVENSKKLLDAAKTKLRVLDDYTRPKMLKTLESDIAIAEAKWEAEKNKQQLELDKLRDMEDQIAKCTITAPKAGIVKFAHERDMRGESDFIVQEGADIRERQVIIRLPDSTKMRVEMTVNESMIQHVRPGMAATIEPVGASNISLQGRVERINQYAEPTGWRKANVKEYKAFIAISDSVQDLRPGMTASVTIESLHLDDVLQAPVQAVYQHGPKRYCFVSRGGRLHATEVTTGPTNDKFFVIESGLDEGDRVALNPRSLLEWVELPVLTPESADPATPAEPGDGAAPPAAPGKTVAAVDAGDSATGG